MKMVIRTDASYQIGTGHVMRCLTLAKALVEKDANVQFICRDHAGNLIDKIQNEGFKVFTLTTRHGERLPNGHLAHAEWLSVTQQQDAQDCQPILEQINPDWLIVDHYAIDQAWQLSLKPYYQKLMVIDDLGDRDHLCDLLLDQNYGSTSEKYQNRVPNDCNVLAGSNYALLRPEFAQSRETSLKRRAKNQEVKNLLVTLGGVDPENVTEKVLKQLAKTSLNPLTQITVVMGATAPHLASVQQQAQTMPYKTTVKTNVSNMAEIMANADLAIGAAGATTWERCCLGLPTIQMVVAENQRQIAQALANDEAIKLIDNLEKLPGLVQTANQWQAATSVKAALIADGKGCERVVAELLECKNEHSNQKLW